MSFPTLSVKNDTHPGDPYRWQDQFRNSNQRDFKVQLAISVVFGLSAFLAFCVLRPKWTELYNARKKQSRSAARLPELPKSFFGWIPVLYRIPREEVLVSAGLDAFAFLSFFRFAIKYLAITLFFSLTVILPVNGKYTGDFGLHAPTSNTTQFDTMRPLKDKEDKELRHTYRGYLWMHVAFVYFFTVVALYLLVTETKYIIRIRQAYLGTQATVTDRTIRLSGIPPGLRSEEKLKGFIEELSIGKVDSVMLCRNWQALDQTVTKRMSCLRKLEEAWASYLGQHQSARHTRSAGRSGRSGRPDGDNPEHTALLTDSEIEREHAALRERERPLHTIRHGFLGLKRHRVDAIDHFEEKLGRLDEKIKRLREEEFEPTPLAFVTMESTIACQMAVQTILDPVPGQLLASLAPPPADVVWRNTYVSRDRRMVWSWTIMVVIGLFTIFWALLLIPLAFLLRIDVIDEILPGLAAALEKHGIAQSLVQTGLPTLVYTLLSVAVPYLYDWLSNQQGMTSQGDVELSVVSKNFFFVFFNLFIVFTVWGSAASFFEFWNELQDFLRDTTSIASAVAVSLEQLSPFYVNLIMLQGFGLLTFRLLEFGSVSLYPFYLISAKTPRDHAELAKAPVFQYGFYLPQTMLIFVICIVYSVLPASWLIILFGLIYFLIGSFTYKYQLLYAMEHRQHPTGNTWPMICNRIILGLLIFHVAMAGLLALKKAFTQAIFLAPLIPATIWFTVYFQRTFFPLMRFIALRSVDKKETPPLPPPSESAWDIATDRGRAVDTAPETGLRYINPNLTKPLEEPWIRKTAHNPRPDQSV